MRRATASRSDLPGQLLIPFALTLLAMIMVAGLAVDLSGAWWFSERQKDTLQVSKDYVMGTGNEIKYGIKNGSSTLTACQSAIELVKRSLSESSETAGYTAPQIFEITSFELPQSATGRMNRVIGVEITTAGEYNTTLAKTLGVEKIPISSRIDWTINPYASTEVYRPLDDGLGRKERVSVSKGAVTVLSATSVPFDGLSPNLKDALESALGDIDS